MNFGERCEEAFWSQVGDAESIYDRARDHVATLNREQVCREMNRGCRIATVQPRFWGAKIQLTLSRMGHLASDAFFSVDPYQKDPDRGWRDSRFFLNTPRSTDILEFTRAQMRPVAKYDENGIARFTVNGFELAKRILIASYVRAIVDNLEAYAELLRQLDWPKMVHASCKDRLTLEEIKAIPTDSIPVESVVGLCVTQAERRNGHVFTANSNLPHAMHFFGAADSWPQRTLPGDVFAVVRELFGKVAEETVSTKHAAEIEIADSLQLKFVRFRPGSRSIEVRPHFPNATASNARMDGLYSNAEGEVMLLRVGIRFGADFGLKLCDQLKLSSGDIRSPKGQQFLQLLNSWIRKERLAEGLLLERDALHTLPVRLYPSRPEFVSIEQQLRAAICGDLALIKGNFEWSRLAVGAEDSGGFRNEVLQHYQFYLATVAQLLTAETSQEESRRFLFELLRATFSHYASANGSDSGVDFGDLSKYCNDLFQLGSTAASANGLQATTGLGLADAYLRQENLFEQEMEALLAAIEDEKLRQRVVDRMADAKENRFNSFMEALVSKTHEDADGSVTQEIKSMFDGANGD